MSKNNNLKKLSDADLCKTVREIKGVTQEIFGISLGFSPAGANVRISEIESGRVKMSVPVRKLCEYYGGVI